MVAGCADQPHAIEPFAVAKALERFARREPLRRVDECVFGVLALENEPRRSATVNRSAHAQLPVAKAQPAARFSC
jgi:hypothetical protein